MKRIALPPPLTVTVIGESGKPELDENGKQRTIVCDMLWFVRHVLEKAPAFADAGHAGFRAGSRVESAIVAAIDAKAAHFDLNDVDHEPLREYVDTMTEHPAYQAFGRASLIWVDPILNAEDVKTESKEQAA